MESGEGEAVLKKTLAELIDYTDCFQGFRLPRQRSACHAARCSSQKSPGTSIKFRIRSIRTDQRGIGLPAGLGHEPYY